MTIGQLTQLQQRREDLKLKINFIADKTGKTDACISRIFGGQRNPSPEVLESIVKCMGGKIKVTPDRITFPEPKIDNDAL